MSGARSGNGLRRAGLRVAIGVMAGATAVGAVVPAAFAAAPAPAPLRAAALPAAPATSGWDKELQDALDDTVANRGSSAALASVRVDGRTAWKGSAGVSDLASGAPVDADGAFRIGSVTKTFVSTVVLQLVAEHKVRLDDPIEHYLPGVVPNGQHITVRQLLNHTSGIYNYTEDPQFELKTDADLQQWLRTGRWKTYRPRELVDIATAHAPGFAPGTEWSYSNTNYVLAGMLIQQVTGRSWADQVERRIIRPLGLRHTFMPTDSAAIPGPNAHGYLKMPSGPVDITLFNPSVASSAGAGISTTADLTRFNAALLGGRLLRPAELVEMKTTVPAGPGLDYGLGLMKLQGTCGDLWGHNGSTPGFLTFVLGDAEGHRQVALSRNPYDPAYAGPSAQAVNRLLNSGGCGTTASAAAAEAAASAAAAVAAPGAFLRF
ncbi:serine hydrolase domain-containing protein [Kitasatospora sp. NPDC056138]|uniref:serine hydrolase domain-containing protein n=1 Tax=Kitasatospora sp. NPDC056138 TaxID=3345724 RepID=UPI0035DA73CE